ncbi:DUF2341 domain-containing protein, partial [bacterium]|nr:DUF2341 domain-containing protein [bacterium]
MVKRDLVKKLGSLAISILLITLIFFILIPPATAVKLDPGTPSSALVSKGTTITFSDVNLTIRAAERIPVNFLNFSIFDSNDNYITHVKFYINATEMDGEDPLDKFTVTNITDIDNLPYNTSSSFGYDENDGTNHTFNNYGYGYDNPSYTDINVLYTITYTTHLAGTFYAKLFVNSSTHTYASGESLTFTVNEYGLCDAWDYFRSITIDHSYIDADLVNFPILVVIDSTVGAKCDGGNSIRFLDTDNSTEYYYEIEEWNASGNSFVWVKIPRIESASDTVFLMYYGNSDASDNQTPTGVWDANYRVVLHMADYSTTQTNDSTQYLNHGTKQAANEPEEVNSNIGLGQNFDASGDYLNCGTDSSLDSTDLVTVELFVYITDVDNPSKTYSVMSRKDDAQVFNLYDTGEIGGLFYKSTNIRYSLTSGFTTKFTNGESGYMAFTFAGTDLEYWHNLEKYTGSEATTGDTP